MKKDYIGFTRVLVGSHKYFHGSMGPTVANHQKTLGRLTVGEALESINLFANTYQEICCLYAAVSFLKRFPDADARLAFSPEENPLFPMPNRAASKVCLVLDGKVFDIISMIDNKETESFDDLLTEYCDIPIADYCKASLLDGEEFTVLPPVAGHEDENFIDFFFGNKEAECYTLESVS